MKENKLVKRILKVDYHRNGISGRGFVVTLFEPEGTYTNFKGEIVPSDMAHYEGPFLAIQFAADEDTIPMYTAILALDDLFRWSQIGQEEYDALAPRERDLNAWRGDRFAKEVQKMAGEQLEERWTAK